MSCYSVANTCLAAILTLSLLRATQPDAASPPALDESSTLGFCPAKTREVAAMNYTLTARVRLLLFWISRTGVGEGRITLSKGIDGTEGLALLIGSDPARAPRQINRWGYIAERVSASCAELIGVMTEAEEQSVEQARSNLNRTSGAHNFKAIQSWTEAGVVRSRVNYMSVDEDFTYKELNTLLRLIPNKVGKVRSLSLPVGAEPGFLFSVRSLVQESVLAYRKFGDAGLSNASLRRYVFSGSLFELKRTSTHTVREIRSNSTSFRHLLESSFEAHNLTNDRVSRFKITYGVQDPMDGIPVRIVYRPRWWFEAEMLLEDDSATLLARHGGAPWRHGIF